MARSTFLGQEGMMRRDLSYPPSWVDQVTEWIDRFPAPVWLVYLGSATILSLIISVIQWREGAYPPGTFDALHVFLVFQGVYGLALMHYLDRNALQVLDGSKAAMTAEKEEYDRLARELTTLPAGTTWLASILGALFALALVILLLPTFMPLTRTADSLLSIGALVTVVIFVWWTYGALIYHTFHQLLVVDRIYGNHMVVDPFRQLPLYGFSGFTARTGSGLIVLNLLWLLILPEFTSNIISILPAAVFLIAATAAFLLPLLGVHGRLVVEKNRLLEDTSERMQATINELHSLIDRGQFGQVDGLNKVMASLEIENQAIRRIPTWPWQPGTLRGFLGALVLPVFIWLIQFLLQGYLGA